MKVCIIGGTGLISTEIVKLLLNNGHNVTCYNRGQRAEMPQGVKHIKGDRSDRNEFESEMQKQYFDAVIDMICFTRDDALSDLRAFPNPGHFIFTSTVCSYGVDYEHFPVREEHPLRPISAYGQGKVEAERVFMKAFQEKNYPVTIVKPSTTYGSSGGLLRQISWEQHWLQRIKENKPLLIDGEGETMHQFLQVRDIAPAYVYMLGRKKCIGETYNLVDNGFTTWKKFHLTAMKILNKKSELISTSLQELQAFKVPGIDVLREVFQYNVVYSADKIFRDVPEFKPCISLEKGMTEVIEIMEQEGRITRAENDWEDRLINSKKKFWSSAANL